MIVLCAVTVGHSGQWFLSGLCEDPFQELGFCINNLEGDKRPICIMLAA